MKTKTVKAVALTNKGIEDVAKLEIAEKTGLEAKKIKTNDSVVLFEAEPLKLCELCYTGQSFSRLMILLKEITFTSQEEIVSAVKEIDFSDFIKEGILFKVNCIRQGTHTFNSSAIEIRVGPLIKGEFERNNPEVSILIIIISDKCYIGIDLAGKDLSKRQYRMFMTSHELKPTLAYALVRLSGYTLKKSFLDPFTRSGTLAIETSIYASHFPSQYYLKDELSFVHFKIFKDIDFDTFFKKIDDKADMKNKQINITASDSQLGFVTSGQKNAKIAGIKSIIDFKRADVEWLDIKFEPETLDCVASFIPPITERNIKPLTKKIDQLFERLESLISKKGKIVLITANMDQIEKSAKAHDFKIVEKRAVMQGKQEFGLITITL